MAAKDRYETLTKVRNQFLNRARHNALLTIPSLMPLEGRAGDAHLIEPYQDFGARGVTHLSSRMTTALLPAGRPYMRMDLPPEVKMQNEGKIDPDTELGLSLSEQLVQSEVEAAGWRDATRQSLEQLIVAGSVCEFMRPDNTIRVFRLDQFVVRRDHAGRVIEAVIQERFAEDALPVNIPKRNQTPTMVERKEDEEVELYTWITLERRGSTEFYRRCQELGSGEKVGSSSTFRLDKLPYLFPRWSVTPGEDYGRSKVEEHIAALRSLDVLEKGALEQGAMASRNIVTVQPGANAAGLRNRVARALNGDVVVADSEAIQLKSFDNAPGFQLTNALIERIQEGLARAFLLLSGAQRRAERVTATEIERDIQELEAALGGVFSALSQEMMERRTQLLIDQMKRDGKLPPFEDGTVVPVILTGLEALSRERDVSRAAQAGELIGLFGEEAQGVVKADVILKAALSGLGFTDAVNSEAETKQVLEERAQRQALQQGLGSAIPQLAKAGAEGGDS